MGAVKNISSLEGIVTQKFKGLHIQNTLHLMLVSFKNVTSIEKCGVLKSSQKHAYLFSS